MSFDLLAPATELAPLVAAGELSSEALAAACLDRIAAHDRSGAALHAMLRLDPSALDQARERDAERRAGRLRGPLHGLPIVVKDNIDVAGLPTSSGNPALAEALPRADAGVVRRLRAAGAVILGKTNLSEFSFEIRSRSSLGGDVRNPFNTEVTAGGSSGGSAVAVAAGFAVAAVGTDTGGSIRVPAGYNGLVGVRPTHGLLDLSGVAPLAPSTDTVGPIGRAVGDVAILLAAMSGDGPRAWPPGDAASRPRLSGARLGVLRQAFGEDPEVLAAVEQALAACGRAGAVLVDPAELPAAVLPRGGPHVVDWEFRPAFDHYLARNFPAGAAPGSLAEIHASGRFLPDYAEPMARRVAIPGLDHPAYREIIAAHRALRASILALMDAADLQALVYPTSAVPPRSLENPAGGWAPELAACSGFPALTLPVGQSSGGPPIGLELLARPGREPLLLALAADLELRLGRRYRPRLD